MVKPRNADVNDLVEDRSVRLKNRTNLIRKLPRKMQPGLGLGVDNKNQGKASAAFN